MIIFSLFFILVNKWVNLMQNEIKERLFGKWDLVFINLNNEDLNYIQNHAFIDNYSIQCIQEKTKINNYQIVIGSVDDNFFDLANLQMIEGDLPILENEVAIEERLLEILNVKRVGDVISLDSPVKSLRGYKVCGIVSNYTERWNIINWDIKYINCFVITRNVDSINAYINANKLVQEDMKVNMIYYKCNINPSICLFSVERFNLWIIMIVLITFLTLILKKRIMISSIKHKYLANKRRYKKMNMLIVIFFILLNTFLIIEFINEIIFNESNMYFYQLSEKINDKSNLFFNGYGYNDYFYMNVCSDSGCVNQLRELQYIPINKVIFVFNIIYFIFCILVINIVICFLNKIIIEKKYADQMSLIFLKKYYYDYNGEIFLKLFNWKIIFIEVLACIILFEIKYSEMENYDIKNNVMLLSILTIIILFFLRAYVLKKIFIKKINSINLLKEN